MSRLFSGLPTTIAGRRVAALQQGFAGIEEEIALFLGRGGVALVATLDEHRADFCFEELNAGFVRGRLGGVQE